MAKEKKIYDFNIQKTSRTLVTALKRRKNESTVADLVGVTGLPKYQVEQSLKGILDEYAGHMKVTESGEILYYFPAGMRSRLKGFLPKARRITRKVLQISGRVLSFLFKIWIMVMLVGYFVLFIALLLLAMFASIAGGMSRDSDNRSRSRGGGFGSFYLTTRVIELFIHLWLYSGMTKADRTRTRKQGRPLHRSVFAFVFGEGDPNAGWNITEKKTVIRYIRAHKGVITQEEFMAITGAAPDDAQLALNRYMLEYEGEPVVTSGGTLTYHFPELLKTRETAQAMATTEAPRKELIPFNRNRGNTNTWIGVLNSVNLVFGSFFLYYSFFVETLQPARALDQFYLFTATLISNIGNPGPILAIGLGVVPFLFSVLFYLIPAVRRWRENKQNEEIRKENFRKRLYHAILSHPQSVSPEQITPRGDEEKPSDLVRYREKALKQLGAAKGVEVEEVRKGEFMYSFPEIKREQEDVQSYRSGIDLSKYSLGDTVFDSGE